MDKDPQIPKTPEKQEIINSSSEATASVTYNVETPMGYAVLFTVRSDSSTELLRQMQELENMFQASQFKNHEKKAFGSGNAGFAKKSYTSAFVPPTAQSSAPANVTADKCPKCGSPLVFMTTKTGKNLYKCSTQRYDRITRQTTGCDYVKWINDGDPLPTPVAKRSTR